MLAEGVDMSYEDLVSLLAEKDLEKGAAAESIAKSAPRKSIQRQSIVAQVWRKPSFVASAESASKTERQESKFLLDRMMHSSRSVQK